MSKGSRPFVPPPPPPLPGAPGFTPASKQLADTCRMRERKTLVNTLPSLAKPSANHASLTESLKESEKKLPENYSNKNQARLGSEQKRPGANRPPEFVPERESYFLQGIIGKTHTQNLEILREDALGATCSAGPFCLLPND